MNTTKLKRFATEARLNLMDGVRRKLHLLGFDRDGTPFAQPELIQGGTLWKEEEHPETFYQQWTALRDRLRERGVREVVEEAAYTWFNRMMAIRILTMNGLCEPVLRFDPATGLPLLLADARMGRVPEMSAQERVRFDKLMDDDNRTYDQFTLLLTVWCHDNPIIRSCFGSINDFVELLLPDNILRPDGFLAKLNDTPFISEEDYKSAELIGWLYQFYISDRKDEVFAKKGKVEAEEIPAATQIFTPNWIVKYMVENTILPQVDADDEILEKAKYLVKPEKVGTHGSCVREQKVDLEDLKVADFACGSGHILTECFDLLFLLYRAESYSRREAIECIFKKNLTGIDIDLRAKQLATFALLLKACQKDSSFADAHCMPHVITVPEIEEELFDFEEPQTISGYLHHFFLGSETKECSEQLTESIVLLNDADSLGSIIKFDLSSSTHRQLVEAIEHWNRQAEIPQAIKAGLPVMDFILTLSDSYDAIVMNPPYMPTNKVDGLKDYVAKNYPDSKADLFSVFMDVCIDRLKDGGKYGMINMQSWMFLSSFESLRKKIIEKQHIDYLLHLGPRTFDELSGEVVQNAAFVISKETPTTPGIYYRLIDGKSCNAKREMFLADDNRYVVADQQQFEKIPGAPIAYWVSESVNKCFQFTKILDFASPKQGYATGDNERFIRQWPEIDYSKFCENVSSYTEAYKSGYKWFPTTKGGYFRRWYGNKEYVIAFDEENFKLLSEMGNHLPSRESYFKEGAAWTIITSGPISFRYSNHSTFEHCGSMCFPINNTDIYCLIGYLNSNSIQYFFNAVSDSLSYREGVLKNLPFDYKKDEVIKRLALESIGISKLDWDAHETSWDFQQSPLLVAMHDCRGNVVDLDMLDEHEQEEIQSLVPNVYNSAVLEDCVNCYKYKWERLFFKLHTNEEALNRQFIDIYGLEGELSPDVPLNEITILQQGEISINEDSEVRSYPEGDKEIMYKESPISFNLDVIITQLISYIVGVWMGRYRLDRPGLHIAHPNPADEELSKYQIPNSKYQFEIDSDGIIPVLPQGVPFYDNLYNYVEQFVKMVWGETHLQENMNFIEKCLGKPLNDYLMKDFWKYHKKMYQNRPIYWEFASKKGAFRALVYAHRMDRFTVEVLRSKYLLPYIAHIEKKVANMESRVADLSTPERRELDTLRDKTLPELREYADRVEVIALKNITFDLDDGIIKNHALFGDIVTKIK